MKLSVSCPSCGKQFRNIKPELAGKKARCSCGTVVRLEGGDESKSRSKHRQSNPGPTDLLSVDLLGDEMLGDQRLDEDSHPAEARSPQPVAPHSATPKPIQQPPKRSERKQAASDRTTTKTSTVKRASAAVPRGPAAEKSSRSVRSKSRSKSTSPSESVPEIPLTISPTRNKSRSATQRPLFEQSYGDLDEILNGVGDASPLLARPRVAEQGDVEPGSQNGSNESTQPSTRRRQSTLGFLAALGSATLSIWFGLFVAASRFQVVDSFLLASFSTHLRSVFSATFGNADVPGIFQIIFTVLGWLIWCVAVGMILIAIAQFINAFAKLLTDRQPFSWTDGLIAALGVCAVFLLVSITFCETSFARQQHRALDTYEQPFVEEGERLENVTRLRAEIDQRNRSFTINIVGGATVPMSIFVLSMIRLFAKNSEER